MAAAGRRRKFGVEREPNGRAKRPTTKAQLDAIAAAARKREQRAVLDQPHRRGSDDPRLENPLGRLCVARKLRRELYEAGAAYASICACWRGAKGVPMQTDRGAGSATAEGPSDLVVARWERQMVEVERAVVRCGAGLLSRSVSAPGDRASSAARERWNRAADQCGTAALRALRTLVLDEAEVSVADEANVIAALQAAAVELGLAREHAEPFAS